MIQSKRPLVSVVMPAFNTEYEMLHEAVRSILNQTYSNWELIIVDDNSTKYNDFSFLDKLRDKRIRLYHNEEQRGCTYSINKGISLARGKYIARLDSDDIALPRRLEIQVGYLERHPDISILSCRAKKFGKNNKINMVVPNKQESFRTALLFNNIITHSSVMFRKNIFEKDNRCYDESFRNAQDYELWTRIVENGGRMYQLHKCLVMYRVYDGQISSKGHNSEQIRCASRVRKKLIGKYFNPSKKDILCHEALNDNVIEDVTREDINRWIVKMLKINKKNGYFRQHYLKLAVAFRYMHFIRNKRMSGDLGFAFRFFGPELLQVAAIMFYRKIVNYKYDILWKIKGKEQNII